MSDALLLGASLAALSAGLAACVVLARAGVPTTLVRDLLHVGAGTVWLASWPLWSAPAVPLALVAAAVALTAAAPLLARRSRAATALVASVTGNDERWSGLPAYALAVLGLTAGALLDAPAPAAAGLAALALGDGLGGAVGRRWGRLGFRFPWGKVKTVEGSLAVFAGAAAGALAAAAWVGAPLSPGRAALAGLVAAAAEAAAPRSGDNLVVPAAVWAVLRALS